MAYSTEQLWQRFQKYYSEYPTLGIALDLSRMNFPDDFFPSIEPKLLQAFREMADLEKGAIANGDEKRMVGHYWLRNPALAPGPEIRKEIESTLERIKTFTEQIQKGTFKGASGPFKNLLIIGIGGSALGPQFVAKALGDPATDKLSLYFFDNSDPDGIDRVLAEIGDELGQTLCVVISKSGGTKETRNGMLEAEAAFKRAGIPFGPQAVAVTSADSHLDKYAVDNKWLARFPMWDWVGGRTSELSAVGLPAALQGLDIESVLRGARECDAVTRVPEVRSNPTAQLAAMLYYIGNGKGTKNMVVLPYKDRLELFSKYLQQLVMESLGKAFDRDGKEVHQGITVFGNKGSTDQHSYIQQLRDGLSNFFVTFIEVLRDRKGASIEVEPNITAGDYLDGFYQGTRRALYENGRESVAIIVNETSPFAIGVLIALFERAVGFYASLISINAYHQPGIESGKRAASDVIQLQLKIINCLNARRSPMAVDEIASNCGSEDVEGVLRICEHLSGNPDRSVRKTAGANLFQSKYHKV
jgi:glucose-6-phosphate isomerase